MILGVRDMPLSLNGHTYYRISEVAQMVGISKNTIFRWLKQGKIPETQFRDTHGWRLFSRQYIAKLESEVNRVIVRHSDLHMTV
jgi:excisionase family DNA binding protein